MTISLQNKSYIIIIMLYVTCSRAFLPPTHKRRQGKVQLLTTGTHKRQVTLPPNSQTLIPYTIWQPIVYIGVSRRLRKFGLQPSHHRQCIRLKTATPSVPSQSDTNISPFCVSNLKYSVGLGKTLQQSYI